MLLFFLSSLLFLSNSLSLDKLHDHGKVADDVVKNIQMVMKNQTANSKSLIESLEKLDPQTIASVVLLIKELEASAAADLLALQQASASANTAYDDALTTHNAAVAEKVRLDEAISAAQASLDQQITVVTSTLETKNTASGAKTNAQDTLDTESPRLQHESSSLTQVLALINGLDTTGWTLYDGSYYLFVAEVKSWDDARANCQSMNGDLASVLSVTENAFIRSISGNYVEGANNGGTFNLWIGGRDLAGNNQVYTWSDGSAWSYSSWNGGEPNGNSEQCVEWFATVPETWNDSTCSHTKKSLCKR